MSFLNEWSHKVFAVMDIPGFTVIATNKTSLREKVPNSYSNAQARDIVFTLAPPYISQ